MNKGGAGAGELRAPVEEAGRARAEKLRRWRVALPLAAALGGACGVHDAAERAGQSSAPVEVGAEFDLDPDPPDLVLAPGHQLGTLLLRSGDGYLLVWGDGRATFGGPRSQEIAFEPYATRLAPDGSVLDPTGFPLAPPGALGFLERLSGDCSDTDGCLVVLGHRLAQGGVEAVGVRVSGDQILGAAPLRLSDGSSPVVESVTWDGSAFRIVAWEASVGTFTALVDLAGQVGAPIPLATRRALSSPARGRAVSSCTGPWTEAWTER